MVSSTEEKHPSQSPEVSHLGYRSPVLRIRRESRQMYTSVSTSICDPMGARWMWPLYRLDYSPGSERSILVAISELRCPQLLSKVQGVSADRRSTIHHYAQNNYGFPTDCFMIRTLSPSLSFHSSSLTSSFLQLER